MSHESSAFTLPRLAYVFRLRVTGLSFVIRSVFMLACMISLLHSELSCVFLNTLPPYISSGMEAFRVILPVSSLIPPSITASMGMDRSRSASLRSRIVSCTLHENLKSLLRPSLVGVGIRLGSLSCVLHSTEAYRSCHLNCPSACSFRNLLSMLSCWPSVSDAAVTVMSPGAKVPSPSDDRTKSSSWTVPFKLFISLKFRSMPRMPPNLSFSYFLVRFMLNGEKSDTSIVHSSLFSSLPSVALQSSIILPLTSSRSRLAVNWSPTMLPDNGMLL